VHCVWYRYYSERVQQLKKRKPKGARYEPPLTDEWILEAADFGIFLDFASMHQKEDDKRTDIEDALFRHALANLDVIYAHRGLALLLSTRVPEGVDVSRGYYDRGWTNFERALGHLIKPDSLCIDIGLFTVDKACETYEKHYVGGPTFTPLRIGETPFASRSVAELAQQGSYNYSQSFDQCRGLLGALVGSGRRAPLSPEAFAALIATKQFTNGADAGMVITLYRTTASRLLGVRLKLEYHELAWGTVDYQHLGEALTYCGMLEELALDKMGMVEADVAAVVAGLASATSKLRTLRLTSCTALVSLPDVSALKSLEELDLSGCTSLATLPDVSALTSLKSLDWSGLLSLAALPEGMSSLTSLESLCLDECVSLAALPESVNALTSLKELHLGVCTSLKDLPDLSALKSLKALICGSCTSLVTVPDMSALTSLRSIDLGDCTSLAALPGVSSRTTVHVFPPPHLEFASNGDPARQ